MKGFCRSSGHYPKYGIKLVEKMNPMKRTRSMRGVKRPYTGQIAGRGKYREAENIYKEKGAR